MSSIQEILASILQAVYGKDVRQAIHDGVEMAYNKADNAESSAAAAAEAASGSQESAAASAQAASNSASSASDFADAAERYKNEAFHTTPAGYEDFVNDVNSSLNYQYDSGVKNVLNLSLNSIINANKGRASFSGNVCSINGIDYTVNQRSDGGIEIDVNGIATSNSQLFLIPSSSDNTFKNMILNGSPASSDCSLLVSYFQNGTWKAEQFSYNMMDSVFSLDYPQILISIYVKSGTSVNHLKFHPMIRDASISDKSYQPYAQSNAVLTSSLDYLAETGVKNLWDISNMENVRSSGGLTYTKNADGSVTISAGTAQGSSTYFHTFYSSDGIIKPNVTYDVSLGITIGGANNPAIQISVKDTSSSSWRNIKTISGGVQSGTFTAPNSFYALDVQLVYTTGDTISKATTIYPMIKYHGIQDNSFVPYAQSNAALTERTKWKLLMNGNNEHFDLSANSSIDISTLDWEEINVAVQVSTTQWVIIPFNKAFGAGSLLGGYYYSSQYNASICLKLENNIISLNSGWTALTPAFGNSANGEYNAWVYYR